MKHLNDLRVNNIRNIHLYVRRTFMTHRTWLLLIGFSLGSPMLSMEKESPTGSALQNIENTDNEQSPTHSPLDRRLPKGEAKLLNYFSHSAPAVLSMEKEPTESMQNIENMGEQKNEQSPTHSPVDRRLPKGSAKLLNYLSQSAPAVIENKRTEYFVYLGSMKHLSDPRIHPEPAP